MGGARRGDAPEYVMGSAAISGQPTIASLGRRAVLVEVDVVNFSDARAEAGRLVSAGNGYPVAHRIAEQLGELRGAGER